MTERTRRREAARARTVGELQELIAALDRRVPQVQRAGEVAIARAAAALKVEALERIAELQREAGAGGMAPASAEGLCPVECPPRR